MRRTGRAWMSMLAVALALAAPAARQKAADEDEAIRDVVRRYTSARERGNATELAALFTADADQLTSSGEWRRGRAELVPGTLASSKNNTGVRTITIKTVRFPAPGVAIADGEYVIGASQGAAARNMWTSFVMVRSEGQWRISAIRNMLPAAPTP
jgi:uncharacterized protein (TIGR02246 family)